MFNFTRLKTFVGIMITGSLLKRGFFNGVSNNDDFIKKFYAREFDRDIKECNYTQQLKNIISTNFWK